MLSRRTLRRCVAGERGVVVVLFGVLLPVLGLLTMFAIDTAHWWDYSRNLQSRADAAALAAGLQYGNTCATGTPSAAAMDKIGEAAQLYSGPASTSDLPYVTATTLSAFPPTTIYQNIPTLKAGTLDHYHLFINASAAWKSGQSSNNIWPGHSGTPQSFTHGTVCAASYADE
jgi:Flp pilus assembly protein TadG